MIVRKRTQVLVLTFLIFVAGLFVTLFFSPIGKELTLTYFYKADTTGRTYYIAPEGGGGSDSNLGTIDQPWATLAYAKGVVAAGDTIYLRGGTHYLADDVVISKDGTSNAPIKFASYPGEHAVIDCSREPAGSSCISSSGDYHIFENLDIANSPYYGLNIAAGARGTHVNGCKIYNHMNDNIKVNLAWDWTIENSEIYDEPAYQGDDGIDSFAFNGIVRNNYIHDNSYFGVLVKGGSENVEIYNNRLINNSHSDSGSASLVLGGAAGLHYKKNIDGNKDATVYEGTNINAYNNLIVSKGPSVIFWECKDCSAYNNTIYQKDVSQRVVSLNSNLHKNDDGSIKWQYANDGCFIDASGCNCTPAEMCNICPSDAPASPTCRHDTVNATFKNNIIYFQGTKSGFALTPDNLVGFHSSNNLWYPLSLTSGYKAFETGYWNSATRYDTVGQLNAFNADVENNSLMADPQFEDIAALNFRLANTSPAIDHGTSDITSLIHSPLSDLAGVVRPQGAAVDIGAYEYDGSTPPATNHDPVLAAIGNKSVNEGSALSFNISATDSDNDTLTYSASGLPTGATFTAGTRTFAWTPSDTQSGTYNVTFSVSDGKGGSDSETITVTVNDVPPPVNHAPVLVAIGNKTINENSLLSFSISATDSDGDTISYTVSNLPTGATYNAVTKTFSWIPSYTQAGTYAGVHFEASDGLLTDSEDITITVADVNRAPSLASIGNKSVNETANLTFTISASDADNDVITYSASNLPTGSTFNAGTKTFAWIPTASQSGNYTVTFRATDEHGLADSKVITITVNDTASVNRPPKINGGGGKKTGNKSVNLSFTVTASDPDGDPLTFSAYNMPSGATINSSSGAFDWTPAQAGTYEPTIVVTDTSGAADSITIPIEIADPIAPPGNPPPSAQTYKPGDINNDGRVDLLDLSILAAHWEQNYSGADFNGDGIVDLLDLSIIAANWEG